MRNELAYNTFFKGSDLAEAGGIVTSTVAPGIHVNYVTPDQTVSAAGKTAEAKLEPNSVRKATAQLAARAMFTRRKQANNEIRFKGPTPSLKSGADVVRRNDRVMARYGLARSRHLYRKLQPQPVLAAKPAAKPAIKAPALSVAPTKTVSLSQMRDLAPNRSKTVGRYAALAAIKALEAVAPAPVAAVALVAEMAMRPQPKRRLSRDYAPQVA
jgi:hypothetical protein